MRIAMLGGGGIGCCVAGPLHEAGVDITVIEQWDLHVEAMRRYGLRLYGAVPDRTIRLRAMHLHEAQEVHGSFDAVFIALKSYDTEWGALFAQRLLRDAEGPVVTFQNGLNEPTIDGLIGPGRTYGCVSTIGAELMAPGYVMHTHAASGVDGIGFTVGQWDSGEVSSQVRELAGVISNAAPTNTTAQLLQERWGKLVLNCMLNGIAALTGLDTSSVWLDDEARTASIAVGAEALRVGSATGVQLESVVSLASERILEAAVGTDMTAHEELKRLAMVVGSGVPGRASALQDVYRGRRTEYHQLNGLISRLGREHGLETPANDAVVRRLDALGVRFTPQLTNLSGFLDEIRSTDGIPA